MMPKMSTGDWMVFKDMGAYTMSAASCFNGMPKPKCYYIISEKNWLVESSFAES
jgi:ornithine decarboxylase